MNILVLGSGGREHALYEKIRQSPLAENVYFSPGNAGVPKNKRFSVSPTDFETIRLKINELKINLLVVGPEQPLAAGIKDYFAEKIPKLKVFGPDAHSAQLEASKAFSQNFMEKAEIPVGHSTIVFDFNQAVQELDNHSFPMVIKADGLAAGKGVSIHEHKKSAEETLKNIFIDHIFGAAGEKVLLQQFLTGTEASLFAICNGKDAVILPTARDYKRAYDHDEGPNTGGMGSFCPGDALNPGHIEYIRKKIIEPVLTEFHYTGILYVGLMVHSKKSEDLSVIEFNCRLGDPETQCVLFMLDTDLLPYLLWSTGDNIDIYRVRESGFDYIPVKPGCCVNIVLAAIGYPGNYKKNLALFLPESLPKETFILHAGTEEINNRIFSTGGRILNVIGYGNTVVEARTKAYSAVEEIIKLNNIDELQFRTDIATGI